jgi:hypothetical protein
MKHEQTDTHTHYTINKEQAGREGWGRDAPGPKAQCVVVMCINSYENKIE